MSYQEEFNLREDEKEKIMKCVCIGWRRIKFAIRKSHYNPYPTHGERILHVPPEIKPEDWTKFCANENNKAAQSRRTANKRKRQKEIKEKSDKGFPVEDPCALTAVASNRDIPARDVQNRSKMHPSTPAANSISRKKRLVGQVASEAQSAAPKCKLLNQDLKVIATGKLLTTAEASQFFSEKIDRRFAPVLLDRIFLPEYPTSKVNKFRPHFKDIRVGGCVLHPFMCIEY